MPAGAVPAVVSALLWGAFSAASFPAGALVGLLVNVSSTMTGLLIAFGGGALIFAVTVELFGELLERIKDDAADLLDVTIEFVAVVVGASAYMRINAGLLRWASYADHWRRLRSSGVERVGRACMAVSQRIGQPLTPDMTPAMQARVLEHVFRCFVGARMEGVTRQELLHVLAVLGLQTSEEEVDVLITEHCGDDSANAMLTTDEFVAIARAYLKGSSSMATSSRDATRLDGSGEASADPVATASVHLDKHEGVVLGSLTQQPIVQCESGERTTEGSVGEEATDWAADVERTAPRAEPAKDIAATVEGMGGEAASTAECVDEEDTNDLEQLLHTETLIINGPSDRSTSYYHMPWLSLHRPRRRLRLLLMNATEGMDSSVLSIWLGVCMDGLPEAVLIGLLAMQRRMSVPFIASVFVANFPEAMSCAVLCKQREMKPLPVVMMWAFLCLMTGVVAMATAWVFTNEHVSDESLEFYRIKEVAEGLSAGAMLTCVAAAMIPEAIHLGGEGAGFVLVMGFLSATLIKILELAPRDALRW